MGRIVLFIASLFVYLFCIKVDAQFTYEIYISRCTFTESNYTEGSSYESDLNLLFRNLVPKSSSLKFHEIAVDATSYSINGLFQCRYDISFDVCRACVTDATEKIVEDCRSYGEAIVWYDVCMLRYANRTIFSFYETFPSASAWSSTNVSNYEEFAPVLSTATNGVIKNATSASLRFASGETNITSLEKLYSYAQCTPDIDSFGCNNCLNTALSEMIQRCKSSTDVIQFLPSCQLRYSMSPFLNVTPPMAPPPTVIQVPIPKTPLKPAIIAVIAVCASVVLLVLSFVLWLFVCRKKPTEVNCDVPIASPGEASRNAPIESARIRHHGTVNGETKVLGDVEFAQYDFATLATATKDFSGETKLGEGGFGIVYKGTLENGQQLAVKRLSDSSGQGTNEFMTEAYFLAKLQHKNLVRLVGFCSEGDEKLLVYEHMYNSSLDRFLFDPRKRPLLNWATRYKIIMGIAKGLQYLHEDSRLTIIHRDLKPSNILLDKEMNPKIADFGMARLFGGGQKYGNTNRIIGTRGYMAPEYIMAGEYSDKSDVYSFGIMVLEIVSGQKNRMFNQSPPNEDLPNLAWRLWNEGRSFDLLTDPALYNNCSSKDVIRCIQIGLLCVQADAEKRPSITSAVLMLSVELPLPLAPSMSSRQMTMTDSYNGEHQSDPEQSSTKTVTWRAEMEQDLYSRPR